MRSPSAAARPRATPPSCWTPHFGNPWLERLKGVALVSIGPQTSRSCLEIFGRCDGEANPHDLDGLVAACIQLPRLIRWGRGQRIGQVSSGLPQGRQRGGLIGAC
jgi:hypothetical protein